MRIRMLGNLVVTEGESLHTSSKLNLKSQAMGKVLGTVYRTVAIHLVHKAGFTLNAVGLSLDAGVKQNTCKRGVVHIR